MKLVEASQDNAKGLTMIEIIVAMAILSVIAGLGFWVSLEFYKTYNLDSEFNILTSALRKVRNLSMTNFNESAHGIYIEPNRYVIFQGSSYVARNQSFDEIYEPLSVNFSGIGEAVFSQLSGDSSASGTIKINYETKNRQVFINYDGKIDW
ncbi:prepilin-type N-terminal cleavage/methylation domain-containing protein [Candidatus Wolfebacteria bacterium]|nr:prepilin-type N-terminal cleavage/methylation domain-containing protein [Candidatus Wolfebacteria bacterium]